jgi:hypothetical protein
MGLLNRMESFVPTVTYLDENGKTQTHPATFELHSYGVVLTPTPGISTQHRQRTLIPWFRVMSVTEPRL